MQSIDLIPVNETTKAEIDAMFSKQNMFSSVDQFIAMYNSEILTPQNPAVKKIAESIEKAYKNISLSNRKIIILSPSEVAAENSIKLLTDWTVLIKLKRLANNLLDEEYPVETKIVFTKDKPGLPQIEVFNEEEQTFILTKYWGADKIVNQTSQLAENLLARNLIRDYGNNGDSCYFSMVDLIDINDDFINNIERELLANTLR